MKLEGLQMTEIEKETQKLLRRLGANGSYKGFWFVSYGIVKLTDESDLLTHVCKGLYVEVASHFHVNVSCAERNIRTIKHLIWKDGDHELLNEIFGRELMEEPSNASFMDALSAHVQEICSGGGRVG